MNRRGNIRSLEAVRKDSFSIQRMSTIRGKFHWVHADSHSLCAGSHSFRREGCCGICGITARAGVYIYNF